MHELTAKSPVITRAVNQGGRPGTIKPMQSWRSPDKKVKRRHIPQFSKKPGRKSARHLKNSVIADTPKMRKHLETRNTATAGKPDTASAEYQGLHTEDLSIWSPDCSHWANPQYWLRIEEMMVFVDCLNSLSITCGFCTWFCIAPGNAATLASALQQGEVYSV